MADYIVIGLGNSTEFRLQEDILSCLSSYTIFSGGKRHYALVKDKLPPIHQWIDIKGDMEGLFKEFQSINQPIIVFASGDPLFYGFASTIQKFDPKATLKVYPWFNSIQLLCHKLLLPYHQVTPISVHGRSWDELDTALLRGLPQIGVLTDAQKAPASIAQRMLDYRFDNYTMIIGEALESVEEQIKNMTLEEAAHTTCHPLNCILLKQTKPKPKHFGIPDSSFAYLDNRPNMITKMPVRMVSLSQLDLSIRHSLWDIGFCTGSVAIEARCRFPHLQVTAFEKRPECDQLFEVNTRTHSTPGIAKVMGDFLEIDLTTLQQPDAVFIGGHGNRLEELIFKVDTYLQSKGRLVMNVVQQTSKTSFIQSIQKLNYVLLPEITIRVDEHNPITILAAEKP
ncbi:precorrin-6y C5,15-methyltransferase (decarboxylating) subunit CbiE [Xanthocytophaga agilis]|uniref:Precorrin-6y C5,15-methyltransferase (Decarboxylating) subunit CbiE n=1 Tax=Xanthocytophaga agilis TaxID=3048010 RepID=A0AAE3QZV6_9BACT|nr:precorrin-6y C5,15-methyltransferase (decarboxylating) subunit CbiE [Xanthocytophaga agilis]MDJ1499032.1 precorrin-6y C5,15-methyltransferase (decarboxylating) subunit CbiE [Xanthocytophaga agilis]